MSRQQEIEARGGVLRALLRVGSRSGCGHFLARVLDRGQEGKQGWHGVRAGSEGSLVASWLGLGCLVG